MTHKIRQLNPHANGESVPRLRQFNSQLAMAAIILSLTVLSLIIFASVGQAGASGSDAALGSVAEGESGAPVKGRVLTLEGAIALAQERSRVIHVASLAVRKAEVGLQQARAQAGDIDEKKIFTIATAKAKYLAPRQAEAELANARKALEAVRNTVRFQVESAFYGVLQASGMVQVTEAALKRAEQQLAAVKAAYRAGTAPYSDVLGAEAQVSAARADAATARKNEAQARMRLNRILGANLDDRFELRAEDTEGVAGSVAPDSIEGVDVMEGVNEALSNRQEVSKAREALAVAELNLEITARYFTPNTYAYQEALLSVEQARAAVAEAEQDVSLDVRLAYLDMEDAARRIDVLQKAREQARESLRLAHLRYKAGVATNLEVLTAEVALSQAETRVVEAVYAFRLAKARYRQAVGGSAPLGHVARIPYTPCGGREIDPDCRRQSKSMKLWSSPKPVRRFLWLKEGRGEGEQGTPYSGCG